LLGLVTCIGIIASILSPPFNDPNGDEEQNARKRKLMPKHKKKDD